MAGHRFDRTGRLLAMGACRRTTRRGLAATSAFLPIRRILVAFLILPLAQGAQSIAARKQSENKTVTRTFTNPGAILMSNQVDEPTAATPYPAAIAVHGLRRGRVRDVNVTLRDISHSFPSEVDILLAALHNGAATIGSDAAGSASVTHRLLELDDEAAAPLSDNATLVSGTLGLFGHYGPGDAPEGHQGSMFWRYPFSAPAVSPDSSRRWNST